LLHLLLSFFIKDNLGVDFDDKCTKNAYLNGMGLCPKRKRNLLVLVLFNSGGTPGAWPHILTAADRDGKLLLCEVTAKTLKEGLRLLGIGVVEKI
jgi:hypothetical protein